MKKYTWEELAESQDFEHGQEFVKAEDAVIKLGDMGWKEWDGNYEKHTYIVKTEKGVLHECWPNAGEMHSFTTNEKFKVEDKILIWDVL